MTVVAAFVEDGVTYMGGDSCATAGNLIYSRPGEKVFYNGDFLIGCSGSFRQAQVVRYSFEPPRVPLNCPNIERFMVTQFVEALRLAITKAGGSEKNSCGQEGSDCESQMLVAWRDHLWTLSWNYDLMPIAGNVHATGSGMQAARGALLALNLSCREMKPESRLRLALEISESVSAGVRAPFTILKTPHS